MAFSVLLHEVSCFGCLRVFGWIEDILQTGADLQTNSIVQWPVSACTQGRDSQSGAQTVQGVG